ncbi:hypothetical protein OJF2_39120 [Aquisphaera giovannonii]|uniref:DUF4394 domain-containing protein n=1 Tax=Aquisphaera giovannonii TaxID=406548 RepID=A0A5B9W5V8_9BACT|nr:hypothetical protein [Aquisphaera giovannonii]QEH35361.1 hypothetical protein OJF2_39120 [Aquisphaera giovannonii]
MGLSPSSGPGASRRKVRPMLEGLEARWVLSAASAGAVAGAAAGGTFSEGFRSFRYTTPQGTHVQIQMVGVGSLEGTTVDASGALHLLYSKTNSYSKITSSVHGGTGKASLASIYHRDQYLHGATNSLSGVGASVIKMINLNSFNLVAGGHINATGGINTLSLNSVGPATQIQLRALPSDVTAGSTSGTTTSTSEGTSTNVISDVFLVQSLAGVTGEFVSAGNILLQSDPTSPSPPPAPPGVILKINRINGNVSSVPDLLTDARIFGYDAASGQIYRFSLDLAQNSGAVDPTFAPIQVQPAGSTGQVALSVGRDGNELVLMAATGSRVAVYNATTGAPVGSFAIPAGIDMLGSTDTVTVMGSVQANQLQMIDVAASLAAGSAVPAAGSSAATYSPQAGVGFVGGLTGHPGSNQVYSTIAATFNSLTPTVTQLGELTVNTSAAVPNPTGGLTLKQVFSTASQNPIQVGGQYVPVSPSNNPSLTGVPLGSIDAYLAFNNIGLSSGQYTNTIGVLGPQSLKTYATIKLNAPGPITDLSESFRPDLNGSAASGTGPALIDVQGDIQSLRGLSANGLVLNDTGYLNLIRTGTLTNSTIVAQPIGHVKTSPANRKNVTLISTSNRDYGTRGGVTLVKNLRQIGPLSFTNDPTS